MFEVRQYFLKAVVDRIESEQVVLKLDDGQELLWNKKNLPEEVVEGKAIRLVLSTSKTDEEEREKMAKALLNEILAAE